MTVRLIDGVAGGGMAATVELSERAVLGKALDEVRVRVKDAMRTLKHRPIPREVKGMTKTTASIYAATVEAIDDRQRRRPPTSAAIDRADMVIECLYKLDMPTRKILVARGVGLKWEEVIEELGLGCSVRTAQRHHDDALVKILCAMMEHDAKNS